MFSEGNTIPMQRTTHAALKRAADLQARAQRIEQLAVKYPEPPTGRAELRRQWRTWQEDQKSMGNPNTWFRAFAVSKAVES
ncbi:hypothetical protein GTQ99_00425 [Kineococcus sp. T13]|uniref:hypothetical protein n=1 Tax=Kineococcus vitellinus TaxID=2696565 RepID=UPI001412DAF3|nr:hypothetical protein [Kineococcus vitellinus]NAZ73896.1 hypothetical protein [Kineococcus vitellinus]